MVKEVSLAVLPLERLLESMVPVSSSVPLRLPTKKTSFAYRRPGINGPSFFHSKLFSVLHSTLGRMRPSIPGAGEEERLNTYLGYNLIDGREVRTAFSTLKDSVRIER